MSTSATPCDIDPAGQLAFLQRWYLSRDEGFVAQGGAKIKLVLGRGGAGKTHCLSSLLALAAEQDFLTTSVDCRVWPLWGFDHIYRAMTATIDLDGLARRFCERVLGDEGYHGLSLAGGRTLTAWAEASGHDPAPLRVRFDEVLHRRLLSNPDLDYGYALGLARWCTVVAWGGEAAVEAGGVLEHWLRGGRVGQRDCNRLRLRRPADRFTARLWLRSLLHFIRLAGLTGWVAAFDGGETLLAPHVAGTEDPAAPAAAPPHYTRGRRDDFYECLRTLIDDMGSTPGLLLVLAGPPELLGDEKLGLISYQALAERVRSEVQTVELNRFADELVLERLWATDPGAGRELAEGLLAAVAPDADPGLRARALAAAQAQWAARDVTVAAVRRSVLDVLGQAQGGDRQWA